MIGVLCLGKAVNGGGEVVARHIVELIAEEVDEEIVCYSLDGSPVGSASGAPVFDLLALMKLFRGELFANTVAEIVPISGALNYFHFYPLYVIDEALGRKGQVVPELAASAFLRSARNAVNATNSYYSQSKLSDLGIHAVVVYPPVPIVRYHGPMRTRKAKRVLYFGRFAPDKRVELVLELARRLPEFKFALAGRVTSRRYYRELLREAEGLKNVEFVTEVPEEAKPALFSWASVAFHPKQGEHFGIAPLEPVFTATVPLVPCESGAAELTTKYAPCWNSLDEAEELLRSGFWLSVDVEGLASRIAHYASPSAFRERMRPLVREALNKWLA